MRLNNMPPKNKEWLELLSNLSDIAWFLEDKDMIDNADTIRTAIDLLKFFNPDCHSTRSEFEWAELTRMSDRKIRIDGQGNSFEG